MLAKLTQLRELNHQFLLLAQQGKRAEAHEVLQQILSIDLKEEIV